jgi:trk system potassium uptake protein TrkH
MNAVKRRTSINPARIISASFAAVIAIGALLLWLPISSKARVFTPPLDCLFTAASATCVTGLVLYDTYTHWSAFGQGVLLMLIQIGGLGLVTFTSFFNLVVGRKLGLRGMRLASESINSTSFGDVPYLLRMIITFTLTVEAVGALLLGLYFVPRFGLQGVAISVFLAVSAFCNAGFDILGFLGEYTSLTTLNDSYLVLFTIMALIIIGGLGFIVWNDLLAWRKTHTLLLHTKVVLLVTAFLILFGAACFLLFEWDNPATLQPLGLKEKIGAGFLQSVTMRTAGFNSIDLCSMRDATKVFSIVLMFIGAAPGSTGGGIKVTTIAVIIMTAVSISRGKEEPYLMGRRLSANVVYRSLAILFLGIVVSGVVSIVLIMNCPLHQNGMTGIDAVFEAVSAFATVGVSGGVTAVTNWIGKIVLTLTMFIGRVGPVSFGLTLAAQQKVNRKLIVPEGRIIVG